MKDTQVGEAPTLQFEVLSSIVGVMVANESDAPIEIETLSIVGTDGYNWLNNATGAAKYSLEDDAFTESDHGSSLTFIEAGDAPVTIASGESHKFYALITPTDNPQSDKTLDLVINGTALEGALPALEMVSGKHYRLKAIYSTDKQWYRTPFSVKKVEVLPEDTNCHLINPPENGEEGAYRFKMPITRANVFWSTPNFQDIYFSDLNNISNIIGAEDRWVAEIIWKDVDVPTVTGALDKILIDFAPNGNKGIGPNAMVEFDINYDAFEQYGNAVIGIKKANENFEPQGDYLWSWHIWISDYATTGTSYELSNGKGYYTMDRNLGARSNIVGHPSTMGLQYQFGRKDPFLTGNYTNFTNGSGNSYIASTIDGSWSDKRTYVQNGNVPYTVNNPTSFIRSATNDGTAVPFTADWQYVGPVGGNQTTLWTNTTKTIFDPCPKGYKVARRNSFDLLTDGNAVVPEGGTKGNCVNWPEDKPRGRYHQESGAWFPYQGYITSAGILSSTGTVGYGIRTSGSSTRGSSPNLNYYARMFRFATNAFDPDYNSARAHAMAVRCMVWAADN